MILSCNIDIPSTSYSGLMQVFPPQYSSVIHVFQLQYSVYQRHWCNTVGYTLPPSPPQPTVWPGLCGGAPHPPVSLCPRDWPGARVEGGQTDTVQPELWMPAHVGQVELWWRGPPPSNHRSRVRQSQCAAVSFTCASQCLRTRLLSAFMCVKNKNRHLYSMLLDRNTGCSAVYYDFTTQASH